MAFLSSVFGGQPTAPKRIPTDTIIPLHSRDDNFQNRNVSIDFTMRFDSVIDAQKLADALWKLLERPGWRKLGARLRLNVDGKLEYHVPATYSKERPPINFTQVRHHMRISEHEIGARLPVAKDTQELQVFDVIDPLHELMKPKDSTALLADWIYTDKAQLGLHIVNFDDTTLVTLTWLHTLLDAMGRQALLRAWQAVLEGRDDDVPEFWGYDFDPLEKLGVPQADEDNPSNEHIGAKKQETESKNPISTPPSPYNGRIICIPPAYLERLRAEALGDLSSLDSSQVTYNTSNPSSPTPFLSDGDILCAWLTRLIITSNTSLLSSPQRPLVLINVLGMRDVLSTASGGYETLIPKGKAYIGNCVTGIVSPMAVGQVVDMPLGHVAARLRKDVVQQSSREAVEAGQRAQKQSQQSQQSQDVTTDVTSPSLVVISNWTKAKLFETDFSAAIVEREGMDGLVKGRGKPAYINVYGTDTRGMLGSGIGNCVGRDGEGNYWVGVIVPNECAEEFEKAVNRLQGGL
jgi:hypothetical protein